MESPVRQIHLVPPPDRRQSETALAIARGTARLLRSLGFSCVSELPLPSGRRAIVGRISHGSSGRSIMRKRTPRIPALVRRSSSASWTSCRTRTSQRGWAFARQPRDCVSRALFGAFPLCP